MDSDSQGHSDDGFTSDSDDTGFTSYGGSIFPGCRGFTVAGGTFTNVTNNYASTPDVPSDFRMIPLGDIDLLREIRLNDWEAIKLQRERGCVRRVYSAKVDGRKSGTTVALYQGAGAEEKWRQDIARYMSVRHPNIIQVCGAATSGNIHATLFHDDLVAFRRFVDSYRHSPILTVYIFSCFNTQFEELIRALSDTFAEWDAQDCTSWFRASTRVLCVDFLSGNSNWTELFRHQCLRELGPGTIPSLNSPNAEGMAIDSLTLDMYHQLCANLSRTRPLSVSAQSIVNLGALFSRSLSKKLEDSVEFATSAAQHSYDNCDFIPIWIPGLHVEPNAKLMQDAWRYDSDDIFGHSLLPFLWNNEPETWLSQANHIFRDANITSGFENYAEVIRRFHFELNVSTPSLDPPKGFLFLSLARDFQVGPSSFKWPDCAAYWSLDPSGIDRLSTEDATKLGFPSLELCTSVTVYSWDASIYAGLRQFHRAKGFDPDSQDVARHLGHSLYQLVGAVDTPFAHVDDEHSYIEQEDREQAGTGEAREKQAGSFWLSDEFGQTSQTFKLVMNVKLFLILVLLVLWVYKEVCT
ncbi:hypothetical protein DFH06DRAFT_1166274 [Mycena polygramma]|nr:hypothetical protein DFH06DRAFT_1166274 [Mycena polygramma]